MKNWQGVLTTRLTLGGEVMVPQDNSTLAFSTELLNYIIAFATQAKSGHYRVSQKRTCDANAVGENSSFIFTVCVRSVPCYRFKLAYVVLQMAVKIFFETHF